MLGRQALGTLINSQSVDQQHAQLSQSEVTEEVSHCRAEGLQAQHVLSGLKQQCSGKNGSVHGMPAGASVVAISASSSMVQLYSRQSLSACTANMCSSLFIMPRLRKAFFEGAGASV